MAHFHAHKIFISGSRKGLSLALFLFCLYTTSISQMINTHDVSHHMYADDTQVYIETITIGYT